MNLKCVQDLFSENVITLIKEIKEDLIEWKDILCLQTERLSIAKMTVLSKLTYKVSMISIKRLAEYFRDYQQADLKIIWKGKEIWIPKIILKKKHKVSRLTLYNFKIYYKNTVIQRVQYWWKDKYIHHWNRLEFRNRPTQVWLIDFWE